MPDFGSSQFKAISVWLNHRLGTENYRSDISSSDIKMLPQHVDTKFFDRNECRI